MPVDRHTDDTERGPSGPTDDRDRSHEQPVIAGGPVEVRRNPGLSALLGVAASAVAIAYLWRAPQTGAALDWVLCLVMAVVAAFYLSALVDARTPLLVADDLGVRFRLGDDWRGLPWDAVDSVQVHPRRGLLRDGRLVFSPRSLARALEGLDAKGRRHASWNRKMYGAALAAPVGLTTRVARSGAGSLADELAELSRGRATVVEVAEDETERSVEPVESDQVAGPDEGSSAAPTELDRETPRVPSAPGAPAAAAVDRAEQENGGEPPSRHGAVSRAAAAVRGAEEPAAVTGPTEDAPARRSLLGGIGTIVSRVGKGRSHDVDGPPEPPDAAVEDGSVPHRSTEQQRPTGAPAAAEDPQPAPTADGEPDRHGRSAVPLRSTRAGLRAEVTRDVPAALGNTALDRAPAEPAADGLPEERELHRPGSVDLVFEPFGSGRVRPISQLGDPVEPLVIDDFVTEPAYDPVIGPELAAARTRLGLSVDDLAERTRIRPHVIESIEVDDFGPCGGDFYARGHLRTLARVLGKDVQPLLATFEERYATAPINARRVFEAELATGMTGSMRSTAGGPNWGLLIGVVIVLVLVWGAVRLFSDQPTELIQNPLPAVGAAATGEGGAAGAGPADTTAPAPVPVRLTTETKSHVVVRDGDGETVFRGTLDAGATRRVRALPPVQVRAEHGAAVRVRVKGKDRGTVGQGGDPARRTFSRHR